MSASLSGVNPCPAPVPECDAPAVGALDTAVLPGVRVRAFVPGRDPDLEGGKLPSNDSTLIDAPCSAPLLRPARLPDLDGGAIATPSARLEGYPSAQSPCVLRIEPDYPAMSTGAGALVSGTIPVCVLVRFMRKALLLPECHSPSTWLQSYVNIRPQSRQCSLQFRTSVHSGDLTPNHPRHNTDSDSLQYSATS